MEQMKMTLWMGMGSNRFEGYDDIEYAVFTRVAPYSHPGPIGWRIPRGDRANGVQPPDYGEDVYIPIFWGNHHAQFIRGLNKSERLHFERVFERAFDKCPACHRVQI